MMNNAHAKGTFGSNEEERTACLTMKFLDESMVPQHTTCLTMIEKDEK